MTIVQQRIKNYTSINIKANHTDWNETTNYMFGDIAFFDHYYYRSVIDDNKGVTPDADKAPEWLLWRISNRYAQIDLHSTTYTEWNAITATNPADGKLITKFRSDNYNILALGRTHSSNIKVIVRDHLGVIKFSKDKQTYPRRNSNNWYGYYFDAFMDIGEQEGWYFDIPPVQGGEITVEVTPDGEGSAKVGFMNAGTAVWAGDTLFGISTAIEDNSIWQTDDFGITTVIERDASESLDLDVQYPSVMSNEIKFNVRDIVGKIVLFIGDESPDTRYDHLMILGKVDGFTPVITNPIMTKASFSVSEIF